MSLSIIVCIRITLLNGLEKFRRIRVCRIQVYLQVLIHRLMPTLARLNKTDLSNVLFKVFFCPHCLF